jgi:CRP/FNR family cyclic AMP-dependent transcriptional regulator
VEVFLTNDEGRKIIINTQTAGDIFGELALLDHTPRSASVMTTETSQLGVLSREDFEQILLEQPIVALNILKQMTSRIRMLSESVKSLALLDVYGRVAKTLIDMAQSQNGIMVIEDRPTHQDIADRIGSSREMVSRIMKDLATGQYITIEGKGLIIHDYLPKHY